MEVKDWSLGNARLLWLLSVCVYLPIIGNHQSGRQESTQVDMVYLLELRKPLEDV